MDRTNIGLNRPKLSHACLEKAGEMIFWVLPDGNFLYVNPKVASTLGYSREELYAGGAALVMAGITEEGRLKLRERLRTEQSIELRAGLRRRNGDIVPVAVNMNLVEVDGQEIDCAFCRDITDELKYEQALIDEKDRLVWQNENLKLAAGMGSEGKIVGNSKAIVKARRTARRFATHYMNVLITGESGVGKELFAEYIHQHGDRSEAVFFAVNCASLSKSLAASDLFGHVKGAFTGANAHRRGAFELAEGGTLFLDEVGELPPDVQPMLLRVLESGNFRKVGSEQTLNADIRVVSATNRDLPRQIAKGTFREDLYHRLAALSLPVPPLRDRPEDIPMLLRHFLRSLNEKYEEEKLPPRPEEVLRLRELPFPGNVRELYNLTRRAFVMGDRRLRFTDDEVGRDSVITGTMNPFASLAEVQRAHIVRVLRTTDGKINGPGGAAGLLNINPSTLRARMVKLGIGKQDWRM